MSKEVVIKTRLKNPPEELVYCWADPYERFRVKEDGTVEGLSMEHPHFVVLEREWKLEIAGVGDSKGNRLPGVAKET